MTTDRNIMRGLRQQHDLKSRVLMLEAACHRVVKGQEDEASLKALSLALGDFFLPITSSDPAVLRGVGNVALARAAMLKDSIDTKGPLLHESIAALCTALTNLHHILDAHQ